MATQVMDKQALDDVLNELDMRAQQRQEHEAEDNYWVCQRRYPRHPFRCGCVVRFLPAGYSTVSELSGRTRNLSRTGLGVLVRRVFGQGEPIEVEISPPGRPAMFMGGLVRFCRYVSRGYHELGIELKVSAPKPIFSANPTQALRTLDWLSPQPMMPTR